MLQQWPSARDKSELTLSEGPVQHGALGTASVCLLKAINMGSQPTRQGETLVPPHVCFSVDMLFALS